MDFLLLIKNVPSFCDQLNPDRTELAFACHAHTLPRQHAAVKGDQHGEKLACVK